MRNASTTPILMFVALVMMGCAKDNDDLSAWMRKQGEGARGKVDPIPELKPYEPFVFNPQAVIDPFKPRKVDIGRANTTNAPDMNRRKEALEAYPLEKIKMVGTLQQGRDLTALVRAEDNRIFQVKRGNYMGQNYGVVTAISEAEISLKELTQDGAGEWSERLTKLGLSSKSSDTQAKQ